MRYVNLVVILLLTAAVLVFTFQNLASVTVTFMNTSVTLPITLLVLTVYVLGMLTGGALWSLFRASYRGAFERR
jgi:lipopolysaccharide assembly protein A